MMLNEHQHMCATGEDMDSCLADSGGPLVCFQNNEENYCPRAWLYGAISFGVKCNHDVLPGRHLCVNFFFNFLQFLCEKTKQICTKFVKIDCQNHRK